MPDHVAGFLAQQAVEKSLKAVLMKHGVHYERSHDLDYLCDLIEDGGFEPPESLRSAVAFTPWAARFRYEGPFDPPALERAQALRTVVSIREWATKAIGGGEATETDRVSTSDVETSTPDE
ncbi:MAG: HEPN domain-containing protein [Solirubrobacteraceae bacterium]